MCIGAPVVLRPLQQLHNTQQRGGCIVISYRMNLYEWFTLESSSFTSGMLSTASTSFFFCLTSPSVSVHPAISWDVKLRNPGQSRLIVVIGEGDDDVPSHQRCFNIYWQSWNFRDSFGTLFLLSAVLNIIMHSSYRWKASPNKGLVALNLL